MYCSTLGVYLNKIDKKMGYNLIPRNKKIESMSIGAFSWPVMLQDTGMGHILGYGKGVSPGTYIYSPRGKGGSPVSNDGFKVSSFEAKAMANCAWGYITVKKFINSEYEKMDEEDVKTKKTYTFEGIKMYEQPVGDSFLEQLDKFAVFAESSGGFSIW